MYDVYEKCMHQNMFQKMLIMYLKIIQKCLKIMFHVFEKILNKKLKTVDIYQLKIMYKY